MALIVSRVLWLQDLGPDCGVCAVLPALDDPPLQQLERGPGERGVVRRIAVVTVLADVLTGLPPSLGLRIVQMGPGFCRPRHPRQRTPDNQGVVGPEVRDRQRAEE